MILNQPYPFSRLVRLFPWRRVVAAVALAILAAPVLAAARQDVDILGEKPGPRPFISMVHLRMADANLLSYVQFVIAPKPGSLTRAVQARYSSTYLIGRNYLNLKTGAVTVPVFGLYADFKNSVQLTFGFVDGTCQVNQVSIATAKYKGGIYLHPQIVQARAANTRLSYDFIMLKNFASYDVPIIIDTDGQIRWVGTAGVPSTPDIYYDNSFFVVGGTTVLRIEWDGTVTSVLDYGPQGVTGFHHNFDFGKTGILMDVTTADYYESITMEVDPAGNVLRSWNLSQIISAAMIAGGDDPSKFVPAAGSLVDWFHTNSVAYRPSDDSIVFSSRENFVVALDYNTSAIKWILGDPTKQWYQFPSLRKYALKGTAGTHYPIGQHAVSFPGDKLLLFDDGYQSTNHVPPGKNRSYSAPRKYTINQAAGTATEVWNYLADPPIYSPIASSVYEDAPGNYLIDYATEGPYLFAEILGLDDTGARAFDYKFTELDTAGTAWIALPLHLEDMVFN